MCSNSRNFHLRRFIAASVFCLALPLLRAQQQFLVAPQSAGGGYLWSAAAGDLNGDGKLDIVAGNYTKNSVSVLLGHGDGTFSSPVDYGVVFSPEAVVVGDFNGDGKPDVAVSGFSASAGICSNQCQSLISILLGNGDGTFQPHLDFYSGGLTPLNMTVGDVNGDGKLDLIVSNSQEPGREIAVLLGNGDGTFQPALIIAAGISLGPVVTADFNRDGKLDLALVSQAVPGGAISLCILLGKGDGTFQAPVTLDGVVPASLAVADLNADGKRTSW
jgi:FG-GAP-like repeat